MSNDLSEVLSESVTRQRNAPPSGKEEKYLFDVLPKSVTHPRKAPPSGKESLDDIKKLIESEKLDQFKKTGSLRTQVAWTLVAVLIAQVVFLMFIICFQGFKWRGFSLHDWVFGIFTSGNLLYAYGLVKSITGYLFNGKTTDLFSGK